MAQSYQVDIVTRVVGSSKIAQLDKVLDQLAQSQKKVESQAQGVANSLGKLRAAATGATGAVAKTGAATATAAKGIRATGAAAAQSSALVRGFGQAFSTMLGPLALATAAITTVGKSISIFSERQADVAVLRNGLNNLGLEGTRSLEALQSVADRLGKQTLFDQEQFTRGFALLTSFRSIGVGSYEEVTTAAANMAQVTGQDLNSALLQLSKALEDPARRVTDLSRSGTVFTEQQKEQIRTLQASGDLLGAQKLILAEIEKQYGGAAREAGAAGFAGAMDSAGEAARDLGEAVGAILTPAIGSFLHAITPAVNKTAEWVTELNKAPGAMAAVQGASGGLAGIMRETSEELEYTGVKVDELHLKYQELGQGISVADPIEKAKQEQEQLTESTKKYSDLVSENSKLLQKDQNSIQRTLTVKQAVLNSEKQINDAKLQQAKHDLDSAKSQAEREQAAKRIYDLTITNAKLEYESTLAAAAAEQAKVEAALRGAKVLADQIEAEVALEQAKGNYNEAQQTALDQADQLVTTARENLSAQDKITTAIKNGADAQLEAKAKAAELTMQANMTKQEVEGTNQQIQQVVQNTNNATNAANQTADAWGRAANEASRAAGAAQTAAAGGGFSGGGGGGGGGDATKMWTNGYKPIVTKKLNAEGEIVSKTQKEIEREKNALKLAGWKGGIVYVKDAGPDTFAAAAFDASWFAAGLTGGDAAAKAHRLNKYGGMVGPAGSIVDREYKAAFGNRYAEGGYVTGPQQAVVGEGGEPEYIIPASKMDSAMQRYGSGMRGSAVIPDSANVSINYSGSTVDMGGTSYVNQGDVNGIVKQAVNATLTTLSRSASARLNAGLR